MKMQLAMLSGLNNCPSCSGRFGDNIGDVNTLIHRAKLEAIAIMMEGGQLNDLYPTVVNIVYQACPDNHFSYDEIVQIFRDELIKVGNDLKKYEVAMQNTITRVCNAVTSNDKNNEVGKANENTSTVNSETQNKQVQAETANEGISGTTILVLIAVAVGGYLLLK